MREACYRSKTKQYLHPIIDWTAADVWEYIRSRELPYCSLYDEGQKRIGCVLCPMTRNVQEQIARWPRIAKAWEKAVKATFKEGDDRFRFRTAEEYWQWWLDRDHPNLSDSDPVLFEDDPSEGGE
jgi:phosphoadenosine phosphosulfate reductase